MANNFSPVGDEIQVNLSPNQNLAQLDPDVAVLTDGRFFVAFEDDYTATNIIGQFVNPDGTLAGSNIDIDIGAGAQLDPAVAARAGGAAIVVWEDELSGDNIQYTIVSSAGVAAAERTVLDGVNALSRPDVATLANGSSLVVAEQAAGTNDNIAFRFIDAAGAASGVLDFIDNGADDQFDPAVAAFANNALVVYQDDTSSSDINEIQARFFNGSSFSSEVTIANVGNNGSADVAALTDGRFIVVWDENDTDTIMGRFVSATGTPVGTAFLISDAGGNNGDARVAALTDGGFIVTWENDGGLFPTETDNNDQAVVARRFDSSGAPAGDFFLVNTGDIDSNQDNPAVAANPTTGRAFIVWEDSFAFTGADNEPDGIRGRAFEPTTDVVNDTGGDDVITTYNLGETINATAGDDIIKSLGGNDIVRGGSGFDQLKGGLGDDQLFGEADNDVLKGEEGNDILTGGLGGDTLIGGAGRDTFDFNAVAESRGFNRDVIIGFSRVEDDRIDLSTIDAETGAGNQAFHLIGKAAFTGDKGELRFAGGVLQGDTDGNGVANFEIKVGGLKAPVDGDFFL